MNTPELLFEIAEIAMALAKGEAPAKDQSTLTTADSLLQIVQKGVQAYQQSTGQPLDPALIRPEAPV